MSNPVNPAELARKDREDYLVSLRAELGEEQFAKLYGQAVAKPDASIIDTSAIPVPEPVAAPEVAAYEQDPTVESAPEVEPVAVVPEPAPAPVVPPAPVELPELRFEYQPTDEQGRALGGKQVIKYKTHDELAEKLRDQNIQLVRKLREVTREARLGTIEQLPDDVERFNQPIEFKPKELSVEERLELAQDLSDPAKFDQARDRLLESAVGHTPATLANILNQQQMQTMQLWAKENGRTFMEIHPEFNAVAENWNTVTNWMLKNRLAPTVKNFELAHSRLKDSGLILEAPIVREELKSAEPTVAIAAVAPAAPSVSTAVNSQPPAAPDSRITTQEQPQPKRQLRVPSGLNSRTASATGIASEMPTLTLAEIDRMSSDDYKKRMRDPKFKDLVNKLEGERVARRQSQQQR
jgi:hypothetical protein